MEVAKLDTIMSCKVFKGVFAAYGFPRTQRDLVMEMDILGGVIDEKSAPVEPIFLGFFTSGVR